MPHFFLKNDFSWIFLKIVENEIFEKKKILGKILRKRSGKSVAFFGDIWQLIVIFRKAFYRYFRVYFPMRNQWFSEKAFDCISAEIKEDGPLSCNELVFTVIYMWKTSILLLLKLNYVRKLFSYRIYHTLMLN